MKIQCPGCGARYRLDLSKMARETPRIKCSKCNHVFIVSPSARPAAPKPPRPASAPTPQAASPGRPKVLVVDDARFFRELILDVIGSLPCTFLTASEGREALEIIRRERPALVILDLNLPGLSGFELMRVLRSDPALDGTRLLAMSGVFRRETDIAEATAAGADDFIPKSFRPEQLVERVELLLAKGRT